MGMEEALQSFRVVHKNEQSDEADALKNQFEELDDMVHSFAEKSHDKDKNQKKQKGLLSVIKLETRKLEEERMKLVDERLKFEDILNEIKDLSESNTVIESKRQAHETESGQVSDIEKEKTK